MLVDECHLMTLILLVRGVIEETDGIFFCMMAQGRDGSVEGLEARERPMEAGIFMSILEEEVHHPLMRQ
jgi:hypothetical protein